MKIGIPPNLNNDEIKSFTGIVQPQLEEVYSYNYGKSEFKNVKIFVSKDKFPDGIKSPNFEEIRNILNKIPEKHLEFVSDIYFVSYHCKDDNHKTIKGRTLPIIYKIIIYPKAYARLKVILTHEIGHVLFETGLNNELKMIFATELINSFLQIIFWTQEKRDKFIREEFVNCYDNFINNQERLKQFPLLYDFFKKYIF
ncbi:hypothetical protein HYX05_00390 [Candidatus Woesearchaeota archaeon]|nr:hypothetical protein [Candidatus Woesearchaeota archaeon]